MPVSFFMTRKDFIRYQEAKYNLPFDLIPKQYLPHGFNQILSDLDEEEWLPIPSFEELYLASSYGRIKALEKTHLFGHILKEKILKQNFRGEYLSIYRYKDGVGYLSNVHVIIATTFHKREKHHTCVNHKDGDKFNNRKDNLEWATQSENHLHAVESGLRKFIGVDNFFAKLTEREVIEIYTSKERSVHLSNLYNVHKSTIVQIRSGKIWRRLTKDIKL